MPLSGFINVVAKHAFLPEAHHLADKDGGLIFCKPRAGNPMQTQFVECVLKQQIDRICCIALPTVLLFTDDDTAPLGPAIAVVDVAETEITDHAIVRDQAHCPIDLGLVVIDLLKHPLPIPLRGNKMLVAARQAVNLIIVAPGIDLWEVVRLERPQV